MLKPPPPAPSKPESGKGKREKKEDRKPTANSNATLTDLIVKPKLRPSQTMVRCTGELALLNSCSQRRAAACDSSICSRSFSFYYCPAYLLESHMSCYAAPNLSVSCCLLECQTRASALRSMGFTIAGFPLLTAKAAVPESGGVLSALLNSLARPRLQSMLICTDYRIYRRKLGFTSDRRTLQ